MSMCVNLCGTVTNQSRISSLVFKFGLTSFAELGITLFDMMFQFSPV